MTDEDGDEVARYAYDPYGGLVAIRGDPIATRNPLRYRGYYYDNETQLYYLPARYYNPDTARFLSVDPAPPSAGDPTSLNGYAYCVGDPVQFEDPDGRKAIMDGDDGWHAPPDEHPPYGLFSLFTPTRPDDTDILLDTVGTVTEGASLLFAMGGSLQGIGVMEAIETVIDGGDLLYHTGPKVFETKEKGLGDLMVLVLDLGCLVPAENTLQLIWYDPWALKHLPKEPYYPAPESIFEVPEEIDRAYRATTGTIW